MDSKNKKRAMLAGKKDDESMDVDEGRTLNETGGMPRMNASGTDMMGLGESKNMDNDSSVMNNQSR